MKLGKISKSFTTISLSALLFLGASGTFVNASSTDRNYSYTL